ncbi:hypothetical protein OAH64_03210 [bacterium]|nr:hypothetical protein [bacterium]
MSALQIKVARDLSRDPNGSVLNFYMKGTFSLSISKPEYSMRLVDTTSNSKSGPTFVRSNDRRYVNKRTSKFEFRFRLNDQIEIGDGFAEWSPFLSVPLESLIFAGQGRRLISAILDVSDLARGLGGERAETHFLIDASTSYFEHKPVEEDRADLDDDRLLGILPSMAKEEVRAHLNKLFRKFSSRAGHDDSKISEEASKLLEKVGEARARHIGFG